ncbi:MAG: 16S rRNA (uracil(1498)-N(3))-methyltransferase [Saprospiraceae bacterium]|nr:16S rRNA (uracil(1498)-N(3))-methyltransferase [Saprospiraceae bacterium]
MNLFYTTDIQGEMAILHEEEARHCTQVLRKKISDQIHFVDGKNTFYEGVIIEIGKKDCSIQIQQKRAEAPKDYRVHIAIAPTKNIDRLEWFAEKATEIGIDEISLLLCEHSERKNIRLDRLEKILIAAMKQSLKATLPKLNDMIAFDQFIAQTADEQRFIAYLGELSNPHLKYACPPKANSLVLIGPEGDFSAQEIQNALKTGFKGVSLSNSRLRTETAGLVACHIINFLNE